MLTLPKVVSRGAKRYVAIRREVDIPFTAVVNKTMPAVQRWFDRHTETHGPAIFRYNRIDMPRLDLEMGFVVPRKLSGEGEAVAGIIPAGRYATLTHFGHYRHLVQATAVLIGWARLTGLVWDSRSDAAGEHFASRFELYPNGPADEPDPDKWETQIFIKLRD